jgi:hypothetical protein
MLRVTVLAALIHALGVLPAIHAMSGVRIPQGDDRLGDCVATFPSVALPRG